MADEISAMAGQGGKDNKELPPFIGEAKVREIENRKNFDRGIFCLFSNSCDRMKAQVHTYRQYK